MQNSKFNVYMHLDNDKFCVANTLTGAAVEMDENDYITFSNNDYQTLSAEDIEMLKGQGLLIHEELDETALLCGNFRRRELSGRSTRRRCQASPCDVISADSSKKDKPLDRNLSAIAKQIYL